MNDERNSFKDDRVYSEPWTALRELISDFEPDPVLIRLRMDSTAPLIDDVNSAIDVGRYRRGAPDRRRSAPRGRLPAIAAAASVLAVAGGVLLGTHTGLGRGGDQSPAAVSSSPASRAPTRAAPPPSTAAAPSTGPAHSGAPSSTDPGRITIAEHTVAGPGDDRTSPSTARTSTPSSVEPGIVGVLKSRQSAKCITVPGGTKANGTVTVLGPCGTSADQQWTLTPSHELTIYGGTKCLDVAGRNTGNGARAQIWDCNGGRNQQWTIKSDDTIVGVQSGRCLDATGYSHSDGTPLQTYTCHGGSNQKWTLS